MDRRNSPRLPFYAEVRLLGRAETYFHPTSNLGMGGVLLRTEFPLPVGTRVMIEFNSPIEDVPFRLKAVVAWRQEAPKPGTLESLAQPPIEAGMGVAFVGMEKEDEERLKQLIATLTKEGAHDLAD